MQVLSSRSVELPGPRIRLMPTGSSGSAQQQGRRDAVVEALFHGYFTDRVNVGEADALISLAAGAGLDAAAVGRFLQTKDGVDAVQQEEARRRQLGIRGVPYFVLNGKTVVSGAQPVETFVEAIAQARA